MKRLWITVLATAMACSTAALAADATAKPAHKPGMGMGHKMKMHRANVCKELNLTPEQKEKAREIMKAARERIHKEVLTDAQRAQVDKAREARKEHGLNLTDEQKAKVREITQAARKDAAAATTPEAKREIWQKARQQIHDTVLTPEQQKKADDLRAKREHKRGAPAPEAAPTK